MAPDKEPGRGGGAEAGGALEEAARTRPRQTVQEPDWAAPRGPRTESAGAGPAPAHRLASQSPGPVPCLSDAGLSLPVMHKPHPLGARNPAPPTACQASPPPGKPKPSEAPPPPRFEPCPTRCLSRRNSGSLPQTRGGRLAAVKL